MVEASDELGREVCLRFALAFLRIERLTVKIGDLHDVIVDDGHPTDPGSGERRNDGAPDPAGTDHRYLGGLQFTLPNTPDLRQNDVPGIALELMIREAHWPVEPKPPAPRLVSPRTSTSRNSAFNTGAGTNCAMRSPLRTSKGSLPRLARMTFTSPR